MKTVFVTGAEGFTGARLVKHLQSQRYEVIGGVRNRARKLAFEKSHAKAIVCDVSDAINVARAIASSKPDAIIHLAGDALPGHADAEPLESYQSIVTAWANVLDGARRAAPRAKVVMASACDAYGAAGADGKPLTEDMPLAPVTTFGSLKAAAETLAHTFHRNFHTNVTIARPFHYTGPGQSQNFFFAAIAERLARWDPGVDGATLSLPDLDCRRDLLHVDDVVTAYATLMADGRPDTAYNICSGSAPTVREIVQKMISASGQNVTLSSEASDSNAVACYLGDPGRITREFGWRPTRTMDQALQGLLQSYSSAQSPVMA